MEKAQGRSEKREPVSAFDVFSFVPVTSWRGSMGLQHLSISCSCWQIYFNSQHPINPGPLPLAEAG
jgi:hypothetical protein